MKEIYNVFVQTFVQSLLWNILMKVVKSVLLKVLLAALGFFVVTFAIYMFNLDMKATALLAPLLEKWYDHQEHKQYI